MPFFSPTTARPHKRTAPQCRPPDIPIQGGDSTVPDDPSASDGRIEKMRRIINDHDSFEDPDLRYEYLMAVGITPDTLRSYRRIVIRHDAGSSTSPSPSPTKAVRVSILRSRGRTSGSSRGPSNRCDPTRPGEHRRGRNRSRAESVTVFIIIFEEPE